MATVLGPQYSVEWRGRPPHMLKCDSPIWYDFLEKHKEKFVALYYDCLLGGPGFTPADYDEKLRGMWKYLGSKRADVIAETKEEIWIIEVTDLVSIKALGQLMMYKSLWLEDPKSTKPVEMVLVCGHPDTDILAGMQSYNIRCYVQKGGAKSTTTPQPQKEPRLHSLCINTGDRREQSTQPKGAREQVKGAKRPQRLVTAF